MLIKKEIVVDYSTCTVYHRGKIKSPNMIGTEGKNGTRLRIEIHANNGRRTIVRSKLIYMASTHIIIPKGIDHTI